jgi:hypothetical protein
MGVGIQSVRLFFVLYLIMMVLATILCPVRFYLLRKTRRSTLALWCDIWSFFGWILLQSIGWSMVPTISGELRFRKSTGDIMNVAERYAKAEYMKVF